MITGDTIIHVSLDALSKNIDAVRDEIGSGTALMAVIKADGYGHGALAIAPTLLEHGVSYLAVSRLEEALPLRSALPGAPLFLLGYTPDRLLKTALEHDITLTIFSRRQAQILSMAARELGRPARVHLKIETGFNRLGTDSTEELLSILRTPGIYAEGVYSHLSQMDRPTDDIEADRFFKIVSVLESEGFSFRYKHLADSILAMDRPDLRLDMVRAGAILYGMRSFTNPGVTVRPIMTMDTHISRLRAVSFGEGVGYDLAWRAPRDSLIATLPFGYGDGYPRALSGRGFVTVRGRRCPLVGILCMDQCTADVTDVPDVREGDRAIIYGDGSDNSLTIAQAAEIVGTNKNELLCRLSARPARVYHK